MFYKCDIISHTNSINKNTSKWKRQAEAFFSLNITCTYIKCKIIKPSAVLSESHCESTIKLWPTVKINLLSYFDKGNIIYYYTATCAHRNRAKRHWAQRGKKKDTKQNKANHS